MINVLLVDDHEMVRSGIEALLNKAEGIKVMAVAKTGEDSVDAVMRYQPDVIVMDINMPGIGGVEACRRILNNNPKARIIVLSVCNDGPVPMQLLRMGALGFISKSSPIEEMVTAIHQVMLGHRYLCQDVETNLALCGISGQESPFVKLSKREREILSFTLQGKTIKEMSDMLILSDKTINTYRYRIYNKLKVKNDVELIRLALKFDYSDDAITSVKPVGLDS